MMRAVCLELADTCALLREQLDDAYHTYDACETRAWPGRVEVVVRRMELMNSPHVGWCVVQTSPTPWTRSYETFVEYCMNE